MRDSTTLRSNDIMTFFFDSFLIVYMVFFFLLIFFFPLQQWQEEVWSSICDLRSGVSYFLKRPPLTLPT